MGLWSWLFPSPADRVAKARKYLSQGQAASARLEVMGLELPEALEVLHQAENELARLNLDVALSYGRTGDEERVREYLELAESFHHGGLEDLFRDVRRQLREHRAELTEAQRREKEARDARLMAVDPLGLQGGPSWLAPQPEGDALAPDEEERKARLALRLEQYPAHLRAGAAELGPPFARALLDLDDGRPDLAYQALLLLPDAAPLVHLERARAAHALGDLAAAARALREFAERVGGHVTVGDTHSGVYLAQLLAEAKDFAGGLRVLRSVRATEPDAGGPLFAQLLEVAGELPEAERVLTDLIRRHPGQQVLYAMLANVRLRGGHRVPAMRALEASMEAICCTPGKCGSQEPRLDILRTLATLYLEDGLETERAVELAGMAAERTEQPAWEDVYLAALTARASRDPRLSELVSALQEHTPPDDPRARLLTQHLGA